MPLRLQFVWWPWRFGWPRFVRWGDGMKQCGLLYSICLYPVEIRIWRNDGDHGE